MGSSWDIDESVTLDCPIRKLADQKPFVMSADKKGHSLVVHLRLSPSLCRQADIIKETRGSAYKTRSDVIRDATYKGLAVIGAGLSSDRWKVDAEVARIESETAYYSSRYSDMDKCIKDIRMVYDSNDRERATELLTSYVEALSKCPDSDRYMDMLKSKVSQNGLISLLNDTK